MSTEATAASASDPRPVVATGKGGQIGLWVFGISIVALGAWLFSAMSLRREEISAPRTMAVAPDPSQRISSPPPLVLAPRYDEAFDRRGLLRPAEPRAIVAPAPVVIRETVSAPPPPARQPDPTPDYVLRHPPPPAVVFDSRNAPPPLPTSGTSGTSGSETGAARVTAGRFANPSRTIPQGTVIPAVLETALDSTRPGGVRALVQRDIHAFDGSRVLIQRGSRLYGEYDAQLEPGEKRALIRWTRLIRPDGVTIALDSPASDPLGRAGVRGKVDSKFFQRFGGALLQSVLDVGVGLATRKATDGVIVALPGSTQNVTAQTSQQVRPTLKVRHGTSVSVFVARDLDFSTVEF